MSSLHYVLTLHKEAVTRMFACATEAAKRPYNKISSCTVDTDVKGVKKVHSAKKIVSLYISL